MANTIPTTTYIAVEQPAQFSKCCNKPALPLMGFDPNSKKHYAKAVQVGWKCCQCQQPCEVVSRLIKTAVEAPITERYLRG